MMETINIMSYIKSICLSLIAIGVILILFKRAKRRIVTYREIEDWAKGVCAKGDICHISRLSDMPSEVRVSVRKQNGAAQIINGYKENSSVFVTITDSENNVKHTSYFMGKSLDKELMQALNNEIEHRITF